MTIEWYRKLVLSIQDIAKARLAYGALDPNVEGSLKEIVLHTGALLEEDAVRVASLGNSLAEWNERRDTLAHRQFLQDHVRRQSEAQERGARALEAVAEVVLRESEQAPTPIAAVITDNVIEACAQAAHEVNRAYCLALHDDTQPPWERAPEWQKSSARSGVSGALSGNTPEQSHESWLENKRASGWKHGPVKDPDKREHPCMVPYDQLPPAQRVKDDLFVFTVRAVAEALGATTKGAS